MHWCGARRRRWLGWWRFDGAGTPRPLAGEVAEWSDAGEGAGAKTLTRRCAPTSPTLWARCTDDAGSDLETRQQTLP
jgi:hypothetical protein